MSQTSRHSDIQTGHGQGDFMTESAQWADSLKTPCYTPDMENGTWVNLSPEHTRFSCNLNQLLQFRILLG